jgi:hypothetical protein
MDWKGAVIAAVLMIFGGYESAVLWPELVAGPGTSMTSAKRGRPMPSAALWPDFAAQGPSTTSVHGGRR